MCTDLECIIVDNAILCYLVIMFKVTKRVKQKSRAKLLEFSDGFSFEVGSHTGDWNSWDLYEALDAVKKPVRCLLYHKLHTHQVLVL